MYVMKTINLGVMGVLLSLPTTPSFASDSVVLDEIGHDSVAHEVEHATSSGLPQFDPTWFASQVFWLLVSFLLLYVIFAKKTLPNLSSTIDRRRKQIESDVETTQKLTKEAEAIYEAYEENLKDAQLKARAVVINMENDLKAQADADHKKFRDKAEETILKTEISIEAAKVTALKDIQAIASEIASETVKKLIGHKIDSKNVESIVSSLVKTPETKKKPSKKAA